MDRPRKYWKNRSLPKNYYNYFDICTLEGIEKTKARNAVSEKKVEGIKYLEELRPIEHLFEQFESFRKGEIRNQYGIRRNYYDKWKSTGEIPTRPPGRPVTETGDICNVNLRSFPKDLYEQFKTVVDNANAVSIVKVGYHEMFAVAISEFVQRRPQFHSKVGGNDD